MVWRLLTGYGFVIAFPSGPTALESCCIFAEKRNEAFFLTYNQSAQGWKLLWVDPGWTEYADIPCLEDVVQNYSLDFLLHPKIASDAASLQLSGRSHHPCPIDLVVQVGAKVDQVDCQTGETWSQMKDVRSAYPLL